jgi:hypothetical protein
VTANHQKIQMRQVGKEMGRWNVGHLMKVCGYLVNETPRKSNRKNEALTGYRKGDFIQRNIVVCYLITCISLSMRSQAFIKLFLSAWP